MKGRGYDAAGLDLMVQRYKGWYALRRQERRIKRGDRVGVLGRGIAVVKQVDTDNVYVALWNNPVMRIGRKDIVWDDGNMRWEAEPADVLQSASLAEAAI